MVCKERRRWVSRGIDAEDGCQNQSVVCKSPWSACFAKKKWDCKKIIWKKMVFRQRKSKLRYSYKISWLKPIKELAVSKKRWAFSSIGRAFRLQRNG